ncbi:hypothetical protein EPI10_010242 [Gossypium australe]|nr:hypothetical protein EPI10_010242 [Gossypium australe]
MAIWVALRQAIASAAKAEATPSCRSVLEMRTRPLLSLTTTPDADCLHATVSCRIPCSCHVKRASYCKFSCRFAILNKNIIVRFHRQGDLEDQDLTIYNH